MKCFCYIMFKVLIPSQNQNDKHIFYFSSIILHFYLMKKQKHTDNCITLWGGGYGIPKTIIKKVNYLQT